MDTFTTYAGLLLAVITLATAAGVGFQRGKIAKLKSDAAEADARAERLSLELRDTQALLHKTQTDLDALTRVVTGEAHWTAIGNTLDEHHHESTTHWSKQNELLTRIAELLEKGGATA